MNYKFEIQDNIIIRTFQNSVTSVDVVNSWKDLFKENLITPNIRGLITDLSQIEFQIQPTDLHDISEIMQQNISTLKNIKIAIIINSPKIAIPILFKEQNTNINIKLFSESKTAQKWILE